MLNKKNIYILFLIVLLSIYFILPKKNSTEINDNLVRVEYQSLTRESIAETYTTHGTLMSEQNAEITPEIEGKIEEILVKAGQKVKTGDILIKLKSNRLKERVASLKASFDHAKYDFEKKTEMLQNKSIARKEYQESKAAYDKALAEYNQAKEELAQTDIKAPFEGIVSNFDLSIGSHFSPYARDKENKFITLITDNVNRVVFNVLPNHAVYLNKGDIVTVNMHNTNEQILATIESVDKFVGKTLDVQVTASIAPEDQSEHLFARSYVSVTYRISDIYDAFVISDKSLFSEGERNFIFVKSNEDKIKLVEVKQVLKDVKGIQGMIAVVIIDEQMKNIEDLDIILNASDSIKKESFNNMIRRDIGSTVEDKGYQYEFIEVK